MRRGGPRQPGGKRQIAGPRDHDRGRPQERPGRAAQTRSNRLKGDRRPKLGEHASIVDAAGFVTFGAQDVKAAGVEYVLAFGDATCIVAGQRLLEGLRLGLRVGLGARQA